MSHQDKVAVLYGRNHQRDYIKEVLTTDTVLKKGELYDTDNPATTTKSDDYRAWPSTLLQPTKPIKQETLKTNINFGSYYDGEKKSIKSSDYNIKKTDKIESFKPSNQINIIDLDPRYQPDKGAITSSYAAEFDKDLLAKHNAQNKVLIHGCGNPITGYLRATHFSLGSDKPDLKTEAQAAFSSGQTQGTRNSVAAERAQKDKRTNHVFRGGDYNMMKEPESKSVFTMSYAGMPSTQKGYDHIINSRANIKLDEKKHALSKKLYNYLREKYQNPRDPCQVNLRQAFSLFDKKRTGFITYESMSSVLKRFLGPDEQAAVGDIISLFDLNNDGKIDYLEFENFLNQKFPDVDNEKSLYEETYAPSLLEGSKKEGRGSGVGGRVSGDGPVDGGYQIKTHFRFGEGGVTDNQSLYKGTFCDGAVREKPAIAKPPPPSQMLPVEPEHLKTANSIQREDYHCHFNNLSRIAEERAEAIKKNKSLHEKASFDIVREHEIEADMHKLSLTAQSYPPKPLPKSTIRVRGFESEWNHLKTEDALPELTAGPQLSEHAAAYNNLPSTALGDFTNTRDLRLSRVKDEKTSHLSFGNDSNRGHASEMAVQFKYPHVNPDCPAAGIKGGPIAEHKHTHHSDHDNQSALSDPSVKSLQDAIKQTILVKCYNPRDPLNVNLQKAFKEFDKNNTGKITVTGLRTACKRLQLPVDDATLHRYFISLDKNKDGSIDYHEFADELGIHITHVSKKGLTSVMQSDYTPINERSQNMEVKRRAQPIQPSHYFHLDHSSATPPTTTQHDFAHPLDKVDWSFYSTVQ